MIARILITINSLVKNEDSIPYTGQRYTKSGIGRKGIIQPNTVEETIVANCDKDRLG